jgi:hypothetical protein
MGFLPYLFFEKKLLATTAFLTIVPMFLIELAAIYKIIISKSTFLRILLTLAVIFSLLEIFAYSKIFFFKTQSYQLPQSYLLKEVSLWIDEYKNTDKKIIVSNRMGYSDLLIPYYIHPLPSNITFKTFSFLKEKPQANTIYIGLTGEFVGKGKNLEDREFPPGIEILSKIIGEDEPVFEYGKNIWVGYYK